MQAPTKETPHMARPSFTISPCKGQEHDIEHDIEHYIELARNGKSISYKAPDTSLETIKALIDLAIKQDYTIHMFSGVDADTAEYVRKNKRPDLYMDADFYAGITIPVDDITEELGIKWEDVEDYHLKWLTLYISMKDGRELEYDCEDYLSWDSIDTKRPISLEVREN
jgi:hypothetical protein